MVDDGRSPWSHRWWVLIGAGLVFAGGAVSVLAEPHLVGVIKAVIAAVFLLAAVGLVAAGLRQRAAA